MTHDRMHDLSTILNPEGLAKLGDGEIAYLKPMAADAVREAFPQAPPLPEGVALYGLFSAAGQPILVTDDAAEAISAAYENDLGLITLQ